MIWDETGVDDLQESYRALRTNLEFLMDETTRVIQITSPEAAQGKSTVVANLAVAFSRIGIETIVLDADLRRPRQHEIFGLDNRTGLSNTLALGQQARAQAGRRRPVGDHERPGAAGPDRDAPHPPPERDQGAAAAQGADARRHAAGAAGQRRAARRAADRRRHPARDRGDAEARQLPGRSRPPRAGRHTAARHHPQQGRRRRTSTSAATTATRPRRRPPSGSRRSGSRRSADPRRAGSPSGTRRRGRRAKSPPRTTPPVEQV